MSKSFYKEALLDIVTEALEQPDKSVIIKHTGLNELKKALQQAQKQEKLLELYREKDKYTTLFIPLPKVELCKYRSIVEQIKELENDK